MTEQTAAAVAGGEAIIESNSIDSIVDAAVADSIKDNAEATKEEAKEETKELSPAEELEKLRRAKARDDRRIGKITAQKYQSQKEVDELKDRLAKYEQSTQTKPQPEGAPKESDFTNYADYLEARSDWKVEQRIKEMEGKQKQTQASTNEQNWARERIDTVEKQSEEFAKQHPEIESLTEEYADVITDLPKEIKDAFLAADNAPLAFYNLAKSGKLEALGQMSLVDAKVEIRLAQLNQPTAPKTKAPAPLPASRGSVAGGKRLEDLSGDEMRSFLKSN